MKQYLKLLMIREGKEVLGRKGTNLWLLTFVLIATFASIAFSEGSMIYLKDRMEDPFTNWVNIKNDKNGSRYKDFDKWLREKSTADTYHYGCVSSEQSYGYQVKGKNQETCYLTGRFYENMNSPLVRAIIDDDNVVGNCVVDTMRLINNSLGFIVSQDIIHRLGYSDDELPAYLSFQYAAVGADSIGLDLTEGQFTHLNMPVIAVVKKLPNNVDMIGSTYYYNNRTMGVNSAPFDLCVHESYQHELSFFVPENVKDFAFKITQSYKEIQEVLIDESMDNMRPWTKGRIERIYFKTDTLPRNIIQEIAKSIENEYPEASRVYRFETSDENCSEVDFLSLDFQSLDMIRKFEQHAKEGFGVKLDMAQVASKENFNEVTLMARILSAAMVIFSIVCIIMFMVNLLQSYFQKVKRNLGTFKAFGMNAAELINTYIIILVLIVSCAVVMSLLITWSIQALLPIIGIEKDGFNYLSLWNPTTYIATAVVMVSTVITVVIVMARMLSQTPGDLIYDRN